jgi:hypothetical protein
LQKWPVAARVGVVQNLGKVANRLVGMHAEQERDFGCHLQPINRGNAEDPKTKMKKDQ